MPLGINWQQILLHLFNFFLLSLGLYLFIYAPVSTFMDKRRKEFEKRAKESQRLKEEAVAMKETHEKELSKVHEEVAELRKGLVEKAQERANEVLQKADTEAEQIIREAKQQAKREEGKIRLKAQEEVKQILLRTTREILDNPKDPFDEFIEKGL